MVNIDSPPQWQTGIPAKSKIDYVVALEYPNAIVYDILVWEKDPDGECYWSPHYSLAAKVVGHIRLGDCLKYLTGVETPLEVENYTLFPSKLAWNKGEPASKEVQLAEIPGLYSLIERDDEDNEWSFNIDHYFGHIPFRVFLKEVEEKLPF